MDSLVAAVGQLSRSSFFMVGKEGIYDGAVIESRVARLCQRYHGIGCDYGSRVVIRHSSDITSTCVSLLSMIRVGALCYVENDRLSLQEQQMQQDIFQPHFEIVDEHVKLVGGCIEGDVDSCSDYHDPGIVVFTSGSTGEPKGILHSFEGLLASATSSNSATSFGRGDTWLLSLPLYHVSGLMILLRAIVAGAGIETIENGGLDSLSQWLRSEPKANYISLVPEMFSRLLHSETVDVFRAFTCVFLGGGPVREELIRSSGSSGIRLFQGYGMTETGAHITFGRLSIDSVGSPLRGVEVKIDPHGRILVRSERLFVGFVTKQGFVPREGDWFDTGDLGELTSGGDVMVLGRAGRMFISGGENIYPEELEQAAESFPLIKAAAVIATPSEKWGQRPHLFLEVESDQFQLSRFKDFLRERLASFKIPEEISILPRLPTTPIGKIDYRALRKVHEREDPTL